MFVYGVHSLISETFARECSCIPLFFDKDTLIIASLEGAQNYQKIEELLQSKGIGQYKIEEFSYNEVQRLINTFYTIELHDRRIYERIRKFVAEESYEELFQFVVEYATRLGASDIHINNVNNYCLIKFRIKGKIKTFAALDSGCTETIGRIIKVKGNADISRSLRPMDTRITAQVDKKYIDIRVSIVNTFAGEKISLRILNDDQSPKSLDQLGITKEEQELLKKELKRDSGAIIVTGPTGSGKSTTIRCLIHEINSGNEHIISIEDPIEYVMEGVTQIQVDDRHKAGFEESIRSILRQDPDIIYIGEIRDEITAEVAMKASITGHLVFSTLHTKSIASAYERLENLGIDENLINHGISIIINQRLVNEQCDQCKRKIPYLGENIDELQVTKGMLIEHSEGCLGCDYSGIRRRVPVMAISSIDLTLGEQNFQKSIQNSHSVIKERLIEKFCKGEVALQEATKYL